MDHSLVRARRAVGHTLRTADDDFFRSLSTRLKTILAIVAAAALLAVYFAADPSAQRWMPVCVLRQTTGVSCPGCGTQRAVHALLHGDIAAAWGFNALFVVLIPVVAFLVWVETQRRRRPQLYMRVYGKWTAVAAIAVLAGWMLLRNLLGV